VTEGEELAQEVQSTAELMAREKPGRTVLIYICDRPGGTEFDALSLEGVPDRRSAIAMLRHCLEQLEANDKKN
jgi:hypothetical protein